MPPLTLETAEVTDVADDVAADVVADESSTLKIHDGDEIAGDDAATVVDEPATEVTEPAAVDYDDTVIGVAVEDSKPTEKTDADGNQLHEVKVALESGRGTLRIPRVDNEASTKLREITQVSEEVRRNRERVALLKDELKEAKEDLQGSVNRLMRITAAISNDEARPLLAAAEKPAESVAVDMSSQTSKSVESVVVINQDEVVGVSASTDAPNAESWRSYRFDDPDHFPSLSAQKAIVAKLADNSPPINTIGDLLDFQKPVGDYAKGLTDIKGIGTGKAEKIELALEQFWAEHPEFVQEAVDAS